MTDLTARINGLSPARRELLARLMREKGLPLSPGAIRRVPRPAGEVPLSLAQQGLWFLDQMAPGGHTYNVFESIALDEWMTPDVVKRSLDEIVRRHEALRTTFVARGGQPFQVIADRVDIALPVVDLGALPVDERAAEVGRIIADVARRPFDLAAGPLLRATYLRDGHGETSLLLCMHHIVSDAWSLAIFERELRALCASAISGRPASVARAARAVRRLRGLAARVPAGGRARNATGVLEDATGWRTRHARPSHGARTAAGTDLSGRHPVAPAERGADARPEDVEPHRRRHAVHADDWPRSRSCCGATPIRPTS